MYTLTFLTTLSSLLALSTAAPAPVPVQARAAATSDGQITVGSWSGSDCNAKADQTVKASVNQVLASAPFPPVYCHSYILPVKAMKINLYDA